MEDKSIRSAVPAAVLTAIAAVAFAAMMRVPAGPIGAIIILLGIPISLMATFSILFPLLVIPHFVARKYNSPIFGSYFGFAVLLVIAVKYRGLDDPENLAIKIAVVFVFTALINCAIVESDYAKGNTEA